MNIFNLVSPKGTLMYSEVTTFMKKQSTVVTMYKSIRTSMNKTISLSADHLIYVRSFGSNKFTPM